MCLSFLSCLGLGVRNLKLFKHIVDNGIFLPLFQLHVHQHDAHGQLWVLSPDKGFQLVPLGGLQLQLGAGGVDPLIDAGVADDVRNAVPPRFTL